MFGKGKRIKMFLTMLPFFIGLGILLYPTVRGAAVKWQMQYESEQFMSRVEADPYCRVATASQLSESAVEIQRRRLEAAIREHENWTMANIYVDIGANRMKALERPSFKRMLQDCQTGNVDLILTRDPSRLHLSKKNKLGSL